MAKGVKVGVREIGKIVESLQATVRGLGFILSVISHYLFEGGVFERYLWLISGTFNGAGVESGRKTSWDAVVEVHAVGYVFEKW